MKDRNSHLSNLQPQKCHSHTQTQYFEVLYSSNTAHNYTKHIVTEKKIKRRKKKVTNAESEIKNEKDTSDS